MIIPVLNGAEYIDRIVTFLKEQDYESFEVIFVVDERSDDSSLEKVRSINDPRFKSITIDGAGLLGGSRNLGLDNAEGEFIWFIDVDDRILPTAFSKLMAIQKRYDADVVACNFVYSDDVFAQFDYSGYVFRTKVMTSEEAIEERFDECFPVTSWSKLIRKSVLTDNDIRFGHRFCEDINHTYEILTHSKVVCYYDEPLYVYYQHPGSFCNKRENFDVRGKSELTAYDDLYEYFDNQPPIECVGRRCALIKIRSSGHMTYGTFKDYAKSDDCRAMIKRELFHPMSIEALWYFLSPTTYYMAIRLFFKLYYYRNKRTYTPIRRKSWLFPMYQYGVNGPVEEAERPIEENRIPITISINAYNEAKNIERAISSIFVQKQCCYKIQEIIVVSSGSTDGTDDIVRRMAAQHEEITFIPQAKREGKNSAINKMMRHKSTEIVVLLNADNIFESFYSLDELIKPFKDATVGVTGGHPYPMNDTHSIPDFTVNMMWLTHHYVSLQKPKVGELMAFRDTSDILLPTDMQSDEDIIRMTVESHGLKTMYVPGATILNRGPTTVSDYIKQRTRVNIGEQYMRRKFSYSLPTHDKKKLVNALLDVIKVMGFHPIRMIEAITLELYPRLKARWHVRKKMGDMNIWDQVKSTKRI